ncbi:MAG: hypothetical protein SF097_24380 [Acidobacteriota bacterium]|nr:hypothetical protein [Acidobacteriota bacterium]
MRRKALYKLPRQTAMLMLLLFLAFGASCRGCRRPPANQSLCSDSPVESAPVFINQPVNYCVSRPIELRRGNVQLLVDSSGSMKGFQNVVPSLMNWAQHSFSLLNTSAFNIQQTRLRHFSQKVGIADLAKWQPPTAYQGNTNIHEAIRAAKDSDLTLILTDGIAANGKQGAGDCARGVDIACVAHALRDAMHATIEDGTMADWGLWFMPLIAGYDGTFYTEEQTPGDFQERKVVEQIRADLGVEVEVTNPKTDANGNLVYQYRGPRTLLLIVIARQTDTGRAALQALWERAAFLGLKRINQMREFSAGTACIQPMEVYPGFLNSIQWQKLTEPADPGERSGTMDVSFAAQANKAAIQVRCPSGSTGAGVFTLEGQTANAERVAGCVPINLLPGFSFQMHATRSDDEAALQQILKRAERRSEQSEQLRLCLECNMNAPRFCNDKPAQAQWVAMMDYKHAAEAFAADKADHSLYQQIKGLSTTQPSLEPHRVYALFATLGAFYRDVISDQRSIVLSQFDFCHQQ